MKEASYSVPWSKMPNAGGGSMNQPEDAALVNYPHGRGYGHDYMRGGEVLGGYGYSERDEYAKARGEIVGLESRDSSSSGNAGGQSQSDIRT
jgi:hypothetical protein